MTPINSRRGAATRKATPPMSTIRVIPHRFLLEPTTGRRASLYGACSPGYEVRQSGYTWERHTARGHTVGLCRRPVATFVEATVVAERFAAQFGCEILEGVR